MFYQWAPYVPVAERRRNAAAEMARLARKGHRVSPVLIEGRAIATTPWGKAWCRNLEAYSDFSNRLPRGRTYVRNGSVVDLQIATCTVEAKVSGSSLYHTNVTVKPIAVQVWKGLCGDCAGSIDSLVELLQGRFASGVMERLCRQGDGLFPVPKDIDFDCSCPDGAYMCKHVAAVLYGVGARFDHQPELLFTLRQVDAGDLLAKTGAGLASADSGPDASRTLTSEDVGALFGLEMDNRQPSGDRKTTKATRRSTLLASAGALPIPAKKGRVTGTPDPVRVLLRRLHMQGWLDNGTARAATGLDATHVRQLLQRLVAEGHARVEGRKRGTRYVIT